MEYIRSEEFLKQPKEVQEVFLDWWEPSIGDLFVNKNGNLKQFAILFDDGVIENYKYNKGKDNFRTFKIESIPLLTEGQLRKFIEDKTNTIVETYLTIYKEYNITLVHVESEEFSHYETKSGNLLQAYWKVACEIAKEELSYDKARTES